MIDGAANEGRGRAAAHETETSLLEIFDDERRETLRPDLLHFRLQDANDRVTLRPGERLALASDGVWTAAPPRAVFAGRSCPATAEAVRQLVGQARLNAAGEDTSAIVITAREIAAGPEPEH